MYPRMLGRFDMTPLRSVKGMGVCMLRYSVYMGLRMFFRM